MKLCRFNEKGIAAVRELLPQIKVVDDDLARADRFANSRLELLKDEFLAIAAGR